MDWGIIVLFVNILLLAAGWLLLQQAKSELTARAAESPVLAEIQALQKSVLALTEQLQLESTQAGARLEARCLEARELLEALDRRIAEAEQAAVRRAPRRQAARAAEPEEAPPRCREVYALADGGHGPAAIAERTGLSEGEVELILGLRRQSG